MKTGRPVVEGEHRNVSIRVWVTPTMAAALDAARKNTSRSDYLRALIKAGASQQHERAT